MASLHNLGALAGAPAVLGAASFAAYLVGAIVAVPTEHGLAPALFRRLLSWQFAITRATHVSTPLSAGARKLGSLIVPFELYQTQQALRRYLEAAGTDILDRYHKGASQAAQERLRGEIEEAGSADAAELRPRLLVANQELYGEYDRLSSEAAFRINVSIPLLALGLTAAVSVATWIAPISIAVTLILIGQGIGRHFRATSVIQRAVLQGVIEHPMESLRRRLAQDRGEQ